jgi:hypothetical protein
MLKKLSENIGIFLENIGQHFYENIDETFRKNVESNILSQQMLILKNVGSTFFFGKCGKIFLKTFVIHSYDVRK